MKRQFPIILLLVLSLLGAFGLQLVSANNIDVGYMASPHASSPLLFLPYINVDEPEPPHPLTSNAWLPGYLHENTLPQ